MQGNTANKMAGSAKLKQLKSSWTPLTNEEANHKVRRWFVWGGGALSLSFDVLTDAGRNTSAERRPDERSRLLDLRLTDVIFASL